MMTYIHTPLSPQTPNTHLIQEWVVDLFGGVRTTGQPSHFTYPVEAFDAPRYVPSAETTMILCRPLPFSRMRFN